MSTPTHVINFRNFIYSSVGISFFSIVCATLGTFAKQRNQKYNFDVKFDDEHDVIYAEMKFLTSEYPNFKNTSEINEENLDTETDVIAFSYAMCSRLMNRMSSYKNDYMLRNDYGGLMYHSSVEKRKNGLYDPLDNTDKVNAQELLDLKEKGVLEIIEDKTVLNDDDVIDSDAIIPVNVPELTALGASSAVVQMSDFPIYVKVDEVTSSGENMYTNELIVTAGLRFKTSAIWSKSLLQRWFYFKLFYFNALGDLKNLNPAKFEKEIALEREKYNNWLISQGFTLKKEHAPNSSYNSKDKDEDNGNEGFDLPWRSFESLNETNFTSQEEIKSL